MTTFQGHCKKWVNYTLIHSLKQLLVNFPWINLFIHCYDPRYHKCFYLSVSITLFYLSEWVSEWEYVCVTGCRCVWVIACCPVELIGCCQEFKGQLVPVPGGSPLLPQTASMCVCVKTMSVNKTFKKTCRCWWCLEDGKRGVSLSCCTRASPRPWS